MKFNRTLLYFVPLCLLTLCSFLTGCTLQTTAISATVAGTPIAGKVYGGQQPVVGAKIYLLAANVTGYGGPGITPSATNASVSLLSASGTGNAPDSIGSYVLTNSTGGFSISSDFNCASGTTQSGAAEPLPGNEQVYLYALGGDPGGGTNTYMGLMAALGPCNSLSSSTQVTMNEVTTVAAAFALSGFASDATHVSSSGTSLALVGSANAFTNVSNLISTSAGSALPTTPAGNGTVPTPTIYTLANILAACVNSTGSSGVACSLLTGYTSSNGIVPTDTASAAINIAHNPGANVGNLYGLIPSTGAPYMGGLSSQPNDFMLGIVYSDPSFSTPTQIAIDANGSAWITNYGASSVTELSNVGAPLSGPTGFTGGGLNNPYAVAIDNAGNAWFTNIGSSTITKLSGTGSAASGSPFTDASVSSPFSLAVDAYNNVWVANAGSNSVTKFARNGSVVSPVGVGYTGAGMSLPFLLASMAEAMRGWETSAVVPSVRSPARATPSR